MAPLQVSILQGSDKLLSRWVSVTKHMCHTLTVVGAFCVAFSVAPILVPGTADDRFPGEKTVGEIDPAWKEIVPRGGVPGVKSSRFGRWGRKAPSPIGLWNRGLRYIKTSDLGRRLCISNRPKHAFEEVQPVNDGRTKRAWRGWPPQLHQHQLDSNPTPPSPQDIGGRWERCGSEDFTGSRGC